MSSDITAVESEFMQEVKKNTGLTIVLGIIVALMSLFAMGSPFIAGLSITITVSII